MQQPGKGSVGERDDKPGIQSKSINHTQSISELGAEAGEVEKLEKNPSVPMGTLKPQLKQR